MQSGQTAKYEVELLGQNGEELFGDGSCTLTLEETCTIDCCQGLELREIGVASSVCNQYLSCGSIEGLEIANVGWNPECDNIYGIEVKRYTNGVESYSNVITNSGNPFDFSGSVNLFGELCIGYNTTIRVEVKLLDINGNPLEDENCELVYEKGCGPTCCFDISNLNITPNILPCCFDITFDLSANNYCNLSTVEVIADENMSSVIKGTYTLNTGLNTITVCMAGPSQPGDKVHLYFSNGTTVVCKLEIDYSCNPFKQSFNTENDPYGLKIHNIPNPAKESTSIHFTMPEEAVVTFELFDLRGQSHGVVYSGNFGIGHQSYELNTSSYPKGTYIIKLTANGIEAIHKFQIE